MSRGDLSESLKVLLPVERECCKLGRGRLTEDNRNIINGILWRLRTSAPWGGMFPRNNGNWNSICRRLRRWSACGVRKSVAVAFRRDDSRERSLQIDSTTTPLSSRWTCPTLHHDRLFLICTLLRRRNLVSRNTNLRRHFSNLSWPGVASREVLRSPFARCGPRLWEPIECADGSQPAG